MPKIVDATARRREITEAAARLIARAGLDAVTMRDVAAEAGWTTGVVTHYFADKRELLLETYSASLADRQALRPPDTTAPVERLRATLDGALPLDDSRRLHWLVTLACITQSSGDPELAAVQAVSYGDYRSYVAGLVEACGLAPRAGASDKAAELIALADGIAVQALLSPAVWPPERQRACLRSLLAANGGEGLEL